MTENMHMEYAQGIYKEAKLNKEVDSDWSFPAEEERFEYSVGNKPDVVE